MCKCCAVANELVRLILSRKIHGRLFSGKLTQNNKFDHDIEAAASVPGIEWSAALQNAMWSRIIISRLLSNIQNYSTTSEAFILFGLVFAVETETTWKVTLKCIYVWQRSNKEFLGEEVNLRWERKYAFRLLLRGSMSVMCHRLISWSVQEAFITSNFAANYFTALQHKYHVEK